MQRVHHLGHHQGYTDKLNAAIQKLRSSASPLKDADLGTILKRLGDVDGTGCGKEGQWGGEGVGAGGRGLLVLRGGRKAKPGDSASADAAVRTALRNSGGGYVNHKLFWEIMGPGGGHPSGPVVDAIVAKWGSIEKFKEEFSNVAGNVFGSGWAWLYVDKATKALHLCATPNQDTPAMEEGKIPILALDVWEHAFYLKYQNRKAAYINAWWNVVNWGVVNDLYAEATA